MSSTSMIKLGRVAMLGEEKTTVTGGRYQTFKILCQEGFSFRYITSNLFERQLDSLSDTLHEGDMIRVELMQRRSFFTTKSIAKIDFTECETCNAPDYQDAQDGDNQCCLGCTGELKIHVDSILKVLKTEVKEFQYGPAQLLTLGNGIKGKEAKEYRVTIFQNSPLYATASKITCGERVQVRGWLEEFGPLTVLRVYQLQKAPKKSLLKECLEGASTSSKKSLSTTA